MNIILCGYHWAGCRALEQLLQRASRIFVYTHDAPHHIPCLKSYCENKGVSYTTLAIDSANLPFTPDILISVYYRNIIKKSVLSKCQYKAINLHPSLLPKYRGCSSLTWAMIKGEKEVGFSYHYIEEGIDTGNILLQQAMPIFDWDTQASLYYRVMFEALGMLSDAIKLAVGGNPGTKQSEHGEYFRRGCPYNGEIQADWSNEKVKRFIRAMTFPPYPPAQFKGRDILTFSEFLNVKKGGLS